MEDSPVTKTHSPAVLNEVADWLRRGADIRTRLAEERAQLVARLREVDDALAALPGEAAGQPAPLPANGAVSASDAVRIAIETSEKALKAPEIVQAAQAAKPGLDARTIHSIIYRLRKAGLIRARGSRGSKVYRAVSTQHEAVRNGGPTRTRVASPKSSMGLSVMVLKEAGTPLHADQILKEITARGASITKASLVSNLAKCVKQRKNFYRTDKPNTFGLLVWKEPRGAGHSTI